MRKYNENPVAFLKEVMRFAIKENNVNVFTIFKIYILKNMLLMIICNGFITSIFKLINKSF